MYFLTRGSVEVVTGGTGDRLAVLAEGAYFGEVAVLTSAPRLATVRPLEDCEVYELKRGNVLQLMTAYPEFAAHVKQALARYHSTSVSANPPGQRAISS